MNFLSHHYTLLKCEGKPSSGFFVFGNIVPDLIRIFNKELRLKYIDTDFYYYFNSVINEGITFHHDIDAIFHNEALFHKHSRKISKLLQETEFKRIDKYLFFLAHIMYELILDRIIYKRDNGIICNDFYTKLEEIEKMHIKRFFNTTDMLEYSKDFFLFFRKFREDKWVNQYIDNENMVYALNMVYNRIKPIKFSKKDKIRLYEIIDQSEEEISKDFDAIFESVIIEYHAKNK